MKNDFLNQLQQNGVCQGDHILLAVSGGVDSMVLMDLLYKAKYQFSIAHCNFCLRGADSDADQAFVESMSQYIQIPLFIKKFDTKKYDLPFPVHCSLLFGSANLCWHICSGSCFSYQRRILHENVDSAFYEGFSRGI